VADIFLSYSREDRSAAEAISRSFEGRGWSVWWDRKIAAGSSFDKMIERELESARCVVVLWSGTSIDSDWVKNEASAAVERDVLLPVMIEAVRLPLEFRRKQTLDLSQWNREDDDPALGALFDEVAARLGASEASPRTRMPSAPVPPRRVSRARKTWLGVAALAAVAVTIAAIVPWPRAASSVSYTLVCKGGGPFGIHSEGLFRARIDFVAAPRAASEAMLPGQCAWTDRPLNANEPAQMCYSGAWSATLARRFASGTLVRQQVYFDPDALCLRIDSLH